MRIQINEEQLKNIIESYLRGFSILKLSKKYGVSHDKISQLLKKNNIKIRGIKEATKFRSKDTLFRKIPLEKYEEIKRLYENGAKVKDIALKYGVTDKGILFVLHKIGLLVRNNGENRKNPTNDTFFDCIDTEEKAYILGILYADGYNNEKRGQVILTLQRRDRGILETISNSFYGKIILKDIIKNKREYTKFSIYNRLISKKLVEKGCPNNKSNILEFPKNIMREEFLRHFIRGYIDGDGCIHVNLNKKMKSISVSLTSSLNFCIKFKKYIKRLLNITFSLGGEHNTLKVMKLQLGGRHCCLIFLDWLYKDAIIFMRRKYEKYVIIKKYIPLYSKGMAKKRKNRKCSICEKKHQAMGYCKNHYNKLIYRRK